VDHSALIVQAELQVTGKGKEQEQEGGGQEEENQEQKGSRESWNLNVECPYFRTSRSSRP
jgi:hypothetical protein